MVVRRNIAPGLMQKRWPNFSVAEAWLKKNKQDLDKMNLVVAMADDWGVQLVPRVTEEERTAVGLPLTNRQERDDAIITKATYFTTSRFLGRGQYDRREFKTLREAVDDAASDRRANIYAVYSKTSDTHVSVGQIKRYLVMRGEAPMVSEVVAGGVYQKLNGEYAQVLLTRKDSLVVLYKSLEPGGKRRAVCNAGETFACKFDGILPRGYERRLKLTRK